MQSAAMTRQATSRLAPYWVSPLTWLLAAVSVLSHLLAILLHLPQAVAGAMLAGALMLFALFHGASTYGWRGIVCFAVLCLGISNAFENLSILTGFPFGWYHYSDIMGPRLFLVPLEIGPAYFGLGYLSWTLARAVLGDISGRLAGRLVFATPILATFIMVSWDLTIDPMMSTITGNWIWRDGGSYFGVPLQNFMGWYLTVYVFLQAFALYARRLSGTPDHIPGYWATPLLAYSSIVIAPILGLVVSTSGTVLDHAGQAWQMKDIHAATALVGLFTVLPFWLLAIFSSSAFREPLRA
jgi:uncharacterized membrane protein